jgi:predicted lactoylglutathione lyase
MTRSVEESNVTNGDHECMAQRISLITLGFTDIDQARSFYEGLGWMPVGGTEPDADIFFYQGLGMIIALWERGKLADDTAVSDGGGWGGITLGYCVGAREEVDAILAKGEQVGGTIVRPGNETFWGGYSGVIVDPGGHAWEIAYQPNWTLHEDGSVSL